MSKITFRADDDLVERLEACDASKSEVMREALRTHLDDVVSDASDASDGSVGDALADRIDDLIADRLDAALDERSGGRRSSPAPARSTGTGGDISVNVTLDAPQADTPDAEDERATRGTTTGDDAQASKTRADPDVQTGKSACGGCGESVPKDHVYCPNCGEKRSHRAFCECGDELRTDWAFCPGCGRRTPAADVLKDR